MDKLLPCPFCGAQPDLTENDDSGYPYTTIECVNDGCMAQPVCCLDGSGCTDVAITAWNTRHTPEGWAMVPAEATRSQESDAEDYWQSKRFAAFSDDPRTWAGVYQTMLAAAPKWGGE